MIPILFNKDEKTFTSLGLGQMDATLVEVERERNGNYTLYAEVPFNSSQAKHLTKEMLIKADAGSRTKWQTFKINRTIKDTNADVIKVYADHISMDTINDAIKPKVAIRQQTAEGALRQWANNLVSGKAYDVQSDITHIGNTDWTIDEVENARQALGGVSGSILDVWGGEYEFDNNRIILHKEMGRTAPTVLEYGRNIVSLEYEELIDGVYTSIYPYATYTPKSEDNKQLPDVMVTLDELIIYSEYAGNYETRRIQIVDFSNEFDSNAENPEIPTQAKLRTLAKAYVKNNGYGIPKISQEIDFVDLSKTLDYQDIQVMEEIELNDRVPVYYPNIDAETNDVKVTTTNWDVLNNRYSKITLSTIGAMNSNSITSKLNTAIKDLKAEQKKINNTVPYLINGQGNRVWHTTPNDNMEHKIDDTWFKKNGKYTIIYKWNGSMWEEVLNDETFISEIEAEVSTAKGEAEKASQSAKDADAKAQSALSKAGTNANLLTTHQNTLDTINNTTLPDINKSVSDTLTVAQSAMDEAKLTDSKIATAKEDISGTISNVSSTAQQALAKANTIDSKITAVNNTITGVDTRLTDSISTTSSKAQQALDEANKADGKISEYVTRNGLVSGTTVDSKINDATGEINKKITTVEGKIDGLQVGGRNFILNSGEPLIPRGVGSGGITASTTEEGYYQVVAEKINGNYFYFTQLFDLRTNGQIINNFKQGDDLTFSIDIKSPDSTDIPTLYVYGANNTYQELVGVMGTEFSRFHLTVNFKNSPTPVNIVMGIGGMSGTFVFRHPKIEKGNIATDWTPAPEDNYTQEEFKIFEASYNSSVEGINAKLGTVSNKVDDNGRAFTEFKENEYSRTAERVSDTFTKSETSTMLGDKADKTQLTNYLAKSTYERDAEQSKLRFEKVEKDKADTTYVDSEVTNSANEIKTTLNSYAKTTDLNGLATETYATNKAVSEAGKVKNELTKYAKTTDLTGLASETYATNVAVNEATKVSNELTKYAKSTDLTGLATETYAQTQATTEAGKVEQKLTGYAKTTDLTGLATETYATNKAVSEAGKVSSELTKYELKTGVDSKLSTMATALREETAEGMKTVYTKSETNTLLGNKANNSALNNYVQTATYNEGIDGVSQSLTRVEGKVDGLQIGGRNLIPQSDFNNGVITGGHSTKDGFQFNGVTYSNENGEFKVVFPTNGVDTSTRFVFWSSSNKLNAQKGDKITLSFKGRTDSANNLCVRTGVTFTSPVTKIAMTSSDEIYTVTFEAPIKISNGAFVFWLENAGVVVFDWMKLELGSIATDWTPAPEDTLTQDEYKAFKSDYESTVEGITGQITSLSTSKLDGNTYTNFLSNDYKATAEKATSAFTKVDKVLDASGNVKDDFSRAVYEQNAERQSLAFQAVTNDLVKEATYTAGINGINGSITTIRGDLDSLIIGGENLILNSNFENETENWTLVRGLLEKTSGIFKLDGRSHNFIRLDASSITSDARVETDVTLDSETEYVISAYVHRRVYFIIEEYDTDGVRTQRIEKSFYGNYSRENVVFTTKEKTSYVRVVFQSKLDGHGLVSLVKLERGNIPTAWSKSPQEQLGKADFQVFKGTYEANDQAIKNRLTAIDSNKEGSVIFNTNLALETAKGNSQLITTINKNYVTQQNIDTSILSDKKIKDTRSENQLPSWYFTNYPSQEVREFKQVSTMGVGSGSFGILTTNVPWSGSSGGTVKQKFETNTETHVRQSNSAGTVWGAWSKQVDTSDTTYQKITQTSSLYERVLGSTENNLNTNISRIVQTSNVIQQTVTSAMNVENRNLLITKNATKDSWLSGSEGYPKTSLQPNSGTSTSPDLIEVKSGDKFTLSKNETTLHFRVSFLNSSKGYIDRYVQNAKLGTITPPSGTAYMWVSYPTNADAKVEKGEIATGYSPAPEDTATQSQITQLADNINLKVSKSDLISQINVQAGGVLITSGTNKLNITPTTTYIQNGTIESAMIKSLDAGKITAGTLDASKATITNIDANNITANKTSFVQSAWNGINNTVSVNANGIRSANSNGDWTLYHSGAISFGGGSSQGIYLEYADGARNGLAINNRGALNSEITLDLVSSARNTMNFGRRTDTNGYDFRIDHYQGTKVSFDGRGIQRYTFNVNSDAQSHAISILGHGATSGYNSGSGLSIGMETADGATKGSRFYFSSTSDLVWLGKNSYSDLKPLAVFDLQFRWGQNGRKSMKTVLEYLSRASGVDINNIPDA